jgi:hypothetical protein
MCVSLCDQNSSARTITLIGDIADFKCVNLHPEVQRIQSATKVDCFGSRPSAVDVSGVRCRSLSSVGINNSAG